MNGRKFSFQKNAPRSLNVAKFVPRPSNAKDIRWQPVLLTVAITSLIKSNFSNLSRVLIKKYAKMSDRPEFTNVTRKNIALLATLRRSFFRTKLNLETFFAMYPLYMSPYSHFIERNADEKFFHLNTFFFSQLGQNRK